MADEPAIEGKMTLPNSKRKMALLVFAVAVLAVAIAVVGFAFFLRSPVAVFEAQRISPETVRLGVESCGQRSEVGELNQVEPGTYELEVDVRATLPGPSNDCADLLTVDINPRLEAVTIIDKTTGQVFELSPVEADGATG